MNWPEKIKTIRKKLGLNQVSLAAKLGTSQVYLSQLEGGHKNPGRELLESLVSLGVSADFLLNRNSASPIFNQDESSATQIAVPIIAYAQCGSGGIDTEIFNEQIALPDNFSHLSPLKTKAAELFALRAVGQSMQPEIQPGDIVFFQKQNEIINSKIMALAYQNEPMIKRIEISNGIINLISINFARYPPVSVQTSDELTVYGLALGITRSYQLIS